MAKEYSKYQQGIISRYYDNRDTIMLQKLQELVTELYLAETPAKKKRLWDRVQKAMINLKVPPAAIQHIMEKQNVELLASHVQDWIKNALKKS